MRRTIAALVSILLLALSLTIAKGQQQAPAVDVLWCQVTGDNSGVHADIFFRNDSGTALRSTTWRVRYGSGWFDYTWTSTRSPMTANTTIRQYITGPNLSTRYGSLPSPDNCSLIGATTTSGQTWTDTTVAPMPSFNPTSPPDDATPVPASIDNPTRDPVGIIGCHLHIAGHGGEADLWLRFRNVASTTIDRVVVRALYANSGLDFIDGGAFAPNVVINSSQSVLGVEAATKLYRKDVPPIPAIVPPEFQNLDAAANCVPVSAHFVDGSQWVNPSIGPTEPPIPTPVPTPPGYKP